VMIGIDPHKQASISDCPRYAPFRNRWNDPVGVDPLRIITAVVVQVCCRFLDLGFVKKVNNGPLRQCEPMRRVVTVSSP